MTAFTDKEYLKYLELERHLYAWCLVKYGNFSEAEAQRKALAFYPSEFDDPDRGLKFHDLSWHWAMLQIQGELYWIKHPHLMKAPDEYWEEGEKFRR
ncbi:hypothetical protein [Blastopirellula marina]|uniref:Uncharacterized protein n=1 Tax=Blastopirellula marina TaxID=124 RepID=A0A2S8GTB6_9BACT|nr:hypothetical protein [Blastopirellula marina]PQO47656.1 hypothetical protein C5Y93_03090 [Blastopirellula marina]